MTIMTSIPGAKKKEVVCVYFLCDDAVSDFGEVVGNRAYWD